MHFVKKKKRPFEKLSYFSFSMEQRTPDTSTIFTTSSTTEKYDKTCKQLLFELNLFSHPWARDKLTGRITECENSWINSEVNQMQSDEYLVNNKLSVPPANYNQQGVLTFAGTSVFSYIATAKRAIFTLADRWQFDKSNRTFSSVQHCFPKFGS